VLTVSVVIPVYNGAKSLPELIERLNAVRAEADSFSLAEIILVDDASSDASWAVVTELAERHTWVSGIALARNFGQHPAILAGLGACSGHVIVTMDDDLQHRPEQISALVAGLTPDVDLVYGRSIDEEHRFFRNVTSRVAKWAVSAAASSGVAKNVSGFRAFRSWLVPTLQTQSGPFVSLDVALSWATQRIRPVRIVMDQRRYGASNYTLSRLVRHALTMLFGFSTVPLRIVSWLGLVIGLLGGLLFAFVVIRYAVAGNSVPGFAFLASTVAMFSGAQLLALGVIAEYIARLYAGAIGRPAFVTRERIGGCQDTSGESVGVG
jgi:glycosyltransferase involved in cell wall biosynthesis